MHDETSGDESHATRELSRDKAINETRPEEARRETSNEEQASKQLNSRR